MNFREIKYFNVGLLRGAMEMSPKTYSHFPFVLHPRSRFFRHPTAKMHINGRFVFGYPRYGARMKVFNHRGQFHLDEESQLTINGIVEFCPGIILTLTKAASLSIGANTYFAGNSLFVFSGTSSIGSDCAIAWDVTLMDTDLHNRFDLDGNCTNPSRPIHIGNKVWIGHRVSILKGVEIGDNSIVAAGSIVTKSFPPNSVIAGQPAARIAENDGTWSHTGLGIIR